MHPNYPYKSGLLQGFVTSLHYLYEIPGVKVNDPEAFRKFLQEEVNRCHAEAIEYDQKINCP